MNNWTSLSVQYANQRNYLDELFKVYPCIPEGIRDINRDNWERVEAAFEEKNNPALLKALLLLDLFPIKDSYVAYLKRDPSAIDRNPQTVNRLCGRLYDMGLNEIYSQCSSPKETNRQIGPLFRRWLDKRPLGVPLLMTKEFLKTKDNAVLKGTDRELVKFSQEHLGYEGSKGLDFIAKFNRKYVIGEAKFLTDFGGHQNAQFEDAKNLLRDTTAKAIKVAILDGVLYIPKNTKMYKFLRDNPSYNILSSLVLREFLFQL